MSTLQGNGYAYTAYYTEGSLYYSSDYGVTWQQSSVTTNTDNPPFWNSIATETSGQHVLACSDNTTGLVYASNDYGVTYTALTILPPLDYRYVFMSADGTKYLAMACLSGVYKAYRSLNSGVSFTSQTYGAITCDNPMSSERADTIFLFYGYFNAIYASTDFGITYSNLGAALPNQYLTNSITYSAIARYGNYVYFIFYTIYITGVMYSSDNGATVHYSDLVMERSTPQGDNLLLSISCDSTGQYVFVAASNGYLYTSSNYGVNYVINSPFAEETFKWQQIVVTPNGGKLIASGYTDDDESAHQEMSVFSGLLEPIIPTMLPTQSPTFSLAPTLSPSVVPSVSPSETPSQGPSQVPSEIPSLAPTTAPSVAPTEVPSMEPTGAPVDFSVVYQGTISFR